MMTPSDIIHLFFAPSWAVESYILPQLHFNAVIVKNAKYQSTWWHACVDKELLKPKMIHTDSEEFVTKLEEPSFGSRLSQNI